jgi:hypothetical protein
VTNTIPPRIATWLLERFGPGYRNESLVGDILEEYQQGRTRGWYWRQTLVAICIGRAASLRRVLPRLAASALLRFLTEAAGLLAVMALGQQFRQACASGWMLSFASIVELLAAIGLCISVSLYVSLYRGSAFRNASGLRRSTPIKRLLSVFAVTALSAGTLTWASTAPRSRQQCTLQSTSSQSGQARGSTIVPGHAGLDGGAGLEGETVGH